jgi:hypothetical protein
MLKALRKSSGASSIWKVSLSLGVFLTAGLIGCRHPSAPTRIDQVWKSSESKPALDLPGKLQVKYVDRGGNVELEIQSAANPVILVDVQQKGALDADAKSYSARPDNGVCVTHLNQPENISCGSGITRATVKTETVGDQNTVIWSIPKSEIQTGADGSDIVIELFDQYKQSGTCFPRADDSDFCVQAAPFAKVYHLQFEGGAAQPAHGNGPAIAYFNADPANMEREGNVRLRWSVSGSTEVSIAPGVGNVPAQGETSVFQSKSTIYTLTAKGSGGDTSTTLTVPIGNKAPQLPQGQPVHTSNASPAPTVSSFTADPPVIGQEGYVRLRWAVSGSTAVTIVPGLPGNGSVAATGETPVFQNKSTTYTLTAKGAGGETTSSVTVPFGATAPPRIERFQADPATVETSNSSKLSWEVSGNATRVRIQPGFDSLPAQGEREVSVSESTRYRLIVEGPGGAASSEVSITYNPAPPQIVFRVDPPLIYKGDTATLRWNVPNATRISIEPGIADYPAGSSPVSGEINVTPSAPTRYTLVAEGPGGKAQKDVAIAFKPSGPCCGELVWTGEVHGYQLVNVNLNQVDVGTLQGSLPGRACIVQPENDKNVSIASTPGPRNNYERLVLRVKGNGMTTVKINWTLQ